MSKSDTVTGKIFLADQRGLERTDRFMRYCTFNFGDFYHEHKGAVEGLYVMNEESIAGSGSQQYSVSCSSYILLIPVTGAISFTLPESSQMVEAGEVLIAEVPEAKSFTIRNPYQDVTVSFLQIRIKSDVSIRFSGIQRFNFELKTLENTLQPIVGYTNSGNNLPFCLSLGLFGGRKEAIYSLSRAGSMFWGFVLEGAFEVAGRLLHQGDGLALWNAEEVELEALSQSAIILVVEVSCDIEKNISGELLKVNTSKW